MATLTEYQTFAAALKSREVAGPIQKMISKLSDGVHETSAGLAFMNKLAKRDFTGADVVSWNIINAAGNSAKNYKNGTILDTTRPEFLKMLTLPRAYYSVPVAYYKTDILCNQGSRDKFVDFVAKQIEIARLQMAARLALDLYGTGALDANGDVAGGDTAAIAPLYGIAASVSNTQTTVGTAGDTYVAYAGITRAATTPYLNNQTLQIANLASLTTSNLKSMMQKCSHMGQNVDTILLSEPAFLHVWNLAKVEQWLSPSQAAIELGFPQSIKLDGATIIPDKFLTGTADGGYLSNGTVKKIFMLNMKDGFEYQVCPTDDMAMGDLIQPTNQHVFVQHITWSGQLVGINPRTCGLITWA